MPGYEIAILIGASLKHLEISVASVVLIHILVFNVIMFREQGASYVTNVNDLLRRRWKT